MCDNCHAHRGRHERIAEAGPRGGELIELGAENAAAYLAERMPEQAPWRVTELGGGVSNTVVLAEAAGVRIVLKQALGKLRVEQDWFSDRRRVFRESGALRAVRVWLPGGAPEVIFEDRENLIFAMTAAPPEAQTWKSQLLAGKVEMATAARVGEMLAAIVRRSWRRPEYEQEFGDQTVFDQLRLDPYYRSTAARHAEVAENIARLLEQSAGRRVSLVHGDWSPKNFLVWAGGVMAIDFEVVHFGDPSFDSGFVLNHLVLKSFYRPQWAGRYREAAEELWRAYAEGLPEGAGWIERATVQHLGCLLLARIDGKSPAEYIQDEDLRERVRGFARRLILEPPDGVKEVFVRLQEFKA